MVKRLRFDGDGETATVGVPLGLFVGVPLGLFAVFAPLGLFAGGDGDGETATV